MSTLLASAPAADKTLIDYFLPIPVQGHLTKDVWGADNVLPRDPDDQSRGLNGWFGSLAVHAVSDNVVGPYKDTTVHTTLNRRRQFIDTARYIT
jgi:hypothetical protein